VSDVELVARFTSRTNVVDFGRMIIDGPTHDVLGNDDARAACLGDLDREEAQ
jgi:branched-chain amino acid transport system ATP-binding protein